MVSVACVREFERKRWGDDGQLWERCVILCFFMVSMG